MSKSLLILILVFCSHAIYTQEQFASIFEQYDNNQIKLIDENWKQYFQKNIYDSLNILDLEYFEIPFDSYGSVYPNYNLFNNFTNINFEGVDLDDKLISKYSMFRIFTNPNNYTKLNANIAELKEEPERNFYRNLLNKSKEIRAIKNFSKSIDTFYEEWDPFHYSKTIKALAQKISILQENNKDLKVIYFIHGYNVPYSLAVLQANELMKKINNADPRSQYLLVPIYWVSNSNKKHIFTDLTNPDISDVEDTSQIFKWFNYSNRAYYTGLGLRKIISEVENLLILQPRTYVFAHSLGTTIATTLIINPTSKLALKNNLKDNIVQDCNNQTIEILSDRTQQKLEKKYPIHNDLIKLMISNPIPKADMNIFLSAPAIPGPNTFVDICESVAEYKTIFSTINIGDETLKKHFKEPLKRLKLFNLLGATNLGVDTLKLNETKSIYTKKGGQYYFNQEIMTHKEHNMFIYLEKEPYKELIEMFVNDL